MSFQYFRSLTVTSNSALLPSTQTNFPVLVKISDPTMKTVANGGHIQNTVTAASGPAVTMPADLIFTSDSLGATKIPWEVESYDGTNGVLWAWVLIASCALSSVFYCFYGDPSVVAAQNTGSFTPANVWDTSYKGVYHLADGTTLLLTDSTSNAANGTGINTPTAATGQVDGCVSLASVSSQYVTVGNTPNAPAAITYELWVKATSFPTAYVTPISKSDGTNFVDLHMKSTGKLACYARNTTPASINYDGTGTNTLVTGTWYHLAMTYDSTNGLIGYVNGGVDGSAASALPLNPNTATTSIGDDDDHNPRYWNGQIDEVRISNTGRAANWIKASYNSQNDPTTFITLGLEFNTLPGARIIQSGGIITITGRNF